MSLNNRTHRKAWGQSGSTKKLLVLLCTAIVLLAVVLAAVYLPRDQQTMDEPGAENGWLDSTESPPSSQSTQLQTDATELPPETESTPVETMPEQTQPQQSDSKPAGSDKPSSQPDATTKPTSPIKEEISSGDITCDEFGSYSGQYVEDGRDELVENVAAVRVTNRSDRFLDFATITIDISGKTATFVVTGLPAGRSAWVLEADRMTIGQTESFDYLDCVSSFRDGVIAKTDKVKLSADGNMLTATNNTSKTMENVFVYYRTLHTDGYFLGGITYTVNFGTLEPGESVEVLAGHYDGAVSEIVRIGWQDP